MEKMIILNIEHKEHMFNHFRWFWIRSVYDFTQKDNVRSCFNYLRGELIFTLGAYKDKGGIPTHQDISIMPDCSSHKAKKLFGDSQIAHYLCLDFVKSFYSNEEQNYIHLGFIYEKGSEIIKRRKDIGFSLTLKNARELYFDDCIAKEKYACFSEKAKECRVFWFGSYLFKK